jgi:DNA-directed RNA polymerase omega subunit
LNRLKGQTVTDRTNTNAFEFVVVAGARAKQLLRGCSPRTATTGGDKLVKIAQREVKEGKVERLALQNGE